MLKTVFLFAFLMMAAVSVANASQCRDEKGRTVLWFFALREPHSRRYLFFDDSSSNFKTLEDETFIVRLFTGISLSKDQVLIWNDQRPLISGLKSMNSLSASRVKIQKAHDKGIMYRNSKDKTGFYLLHSVPKFPGIERDILNPTTPESSNYGQSMICISSSSDSTFKTIWKHLKAQKSYFHHDSFRFSDVPGPFNDIEDSLIEEGQFRLVTKSYSSSKSPFEGMLAPLFNSGWLVESWGRPYSFDSMEPFKVINNEEVRFPSASYSSSNDHSKYAVSLDTRGLLCVGGMNHMESQSHRGGSFVCFNNQKLYDRLKNDVMTLPDVLMKK